MKRPVLDYPKYQTFFNNCLKEWYYQYNRGTNFYYADPPGILFTRLRSTKNVKDYKILEDMSHWYFKTNTIDNFSTYPQSINPITFTNNINNHSNDYFNNPSTKILSILHVGYDSWYSRIIAKTFKNSFNVSYCNSYDVAFNTFYNFSMSHETDLNKPFNNLRLVTGNLFNLPLLINSQLFECVVLHLTNKNFKQLMNTRIVESIHDILVPWGCIVLVSTNTHINEHINSFFPITNGECLWIDSKQVKDNLIDSEDSITNRILNNINNINSLKNINNYTEYNHFDPCNIARSDSNQNNHESLNKLVVTCFHKLKNPKPNHKLRKSVYTK